MAILTSRSPGRRHPGLGLCCSRRQPHRCGHQAAERETAKEVTPGIPCSGAAASAAARRTRPGPAAARWPRAGAGHLRALCWTGRKSTSEEYRRASNCFGWIAADLAGRGAAALEHSPTAIAPSHDQVNDRPVMTALRLTYAQIGEHMDLACHCRCRYGNVRPCLDQALNAAEPLASRPECQPECGPSPQRSPARGRRRRPRSNWN